MNKPITFYRCYANGDPYRQPWGRGERESPAQEPVACEPGQLDWSAWWNVLKKELKSRGYSRASLILYRQVLRSLAKFSHCRPGEITRESINAFLGHIAKKRRSWNWTAMTQCVLRTLFDKLGGKSLTAGVKTPKRNRRLPDYLSMDEVDRMMKQAETLRDQLLIGLLFGCGMKPLEACSLKWQDINVEEKSITVHNRHTGQHRELPLPMKLMPIFEQGLRHADREDYIFAGMRKGKHLSTRMVDFIVKALAKAAGIDRQVTAMMLRHGYAMYCLEYGYNIREVQVLLGHRDVKTTMRYVHMAPPPDAISPLDLQSQPTSQPPALPYEEMFDEEDVLTEELEDIISLDNPLKSFCRLLKTRLRGSFATMRRNSANPASPSHPP